jgi:hypothetical protein
MGPTRQPRLADTLELELAYVSAWVDATPYEFRLQYQTLNTALDERGYEVMSRSNRPVFLRAGGEREHPEAFVFVFDLKLRRRGGRNARSYRLMPPIRPVSDLRLFPDAEKHGADKNWILFFMEEVSEQYGVLFQGFDLFPVTLAELREHAPEQLVAWDAFLDRGGVALPQFYRGTNPLAPTED